MAEIKKEDLSFVSEYDATVMRKTPKFAWLSIALIAALFVAGLIWATFARFDVSVSGTGKVIPSRFVQTVQNLEGGILKELNVQRGDTVKKGQIVAVLDDTLIRARFEENLARYNVVVAELARLEAEALDRKTITFPKGFREKHSTLVEIQEKLFQANRHSLAAEVKTLHTTLTLTEKELGYVAPLVKERVMSELDKLQLERQIQNLRGKIQEKITSRRSENRKDISKLLSEKAVLEKKLHALMDQLKRTRIRAPIDGVVNKVFATTVGEVIKSGHKIMDIVPLEPRLTIEVFVEPKDIGFVKEGQLATIYVSAYPYNFYGFLTGKVTHVSPHTITDEKGNSYYEVTVKTEKNHLDYEGKELPIIPGMQVVVYVATEKRTVMQYLLKPLYFVRQHG